MSSRGERRRAKREAEREARRRDRYGAEGRPFGMVAAHGTPDVDTPKFNLWQLNKPDAEQRASLQRKALLEVDFDAGEHVHETWVWSFVPPGGDEAADAFEMKVLSKRGPDGRIWAIGALQRPDGSTAFTLGGDWMDEEGHRKLIEATRKVAIMSGNGLRPPTVTREHEHRRMYEEFHD